MNNFFRKEISLDFSAWIIQRPLTFLWTLGNYIFSLKWRKLNHTNSFHYEHTFKYISNIFLWQSNMYIWTNLKFFNVSNLEPNFDCFLHRPRLTGWGALWKALGHSRFTNMAQLGTKINGRYKQSFIQIIVCLLQSHLYDSKDMKLNTKYRKS